MTIARPAPNTEARHNAFAALEMVKLEAERLPVIGSERHGLTRAIAALESRLRELDREYLSACRSDASAAEKREAIRGMAQELRELKR